MRRSKRASAFSSHAQLGLLLGGLVIGFYGLSGRDASAQGNPDTEVGGVLVKDTLLTAAGSPYIISRRIRVAPGVTLTLAPGVEMRFMPEQYVSVSDGGRFVVEGTADRPVRLTSNAPKPKPGDWRGIFFYEKSAGSLAYCDIAYGGTSGEEALTLQTGAAVSLRQVAIHDSAGYGALFYPGVAGVFEGVNIANSAGPAFYYTGDDAAIEFRNLTLTGNHPDGAVLGNGSTGDMHITLPGYPSIVANPINVGDRSTLTIGPGVDLRFPTSGYLQINGGGKLVAEGTPDRPISLASANTPAAPGDWRGIWFYEGSEARLSWCNIANAGRKSEQAVWIGSSAVAIRNSAIRGSAGLGIWTGRGASATITRSQIEGNAFGVLNDTPSSGLNAAYNWWGDPNGPQTPENGLATKGDAVSGGVRFNPWLDSPAGALAAPGDVNSDGKVNVLDATIALLLAVGVSTPTRTQLSAADLNDDLKLDVKDAVLVLKRAVGL